MPEASRLTISKSLAFAVSIFMPSRLFKSPRRTFVVAFLSFKVRFFVWYFLRCKRVSIWTRSRFMMASLLSRVRWAFWVVLNAAILLSQFFIRSVRFFFGLPPKKTSIFDLDPCQSIFANKESPPISVHFFSFCLLASFFTVPAVFAFSTVFTVFNVFS